MWVELLGAAGLEYTCAFGLVSVKNISSARISNQGIVVFTHADRSVTVRKYWGRIVCDPVPARRGR